MALKPVPSPLGDADKPAHFFDRSASSTFIIRRTENLVVASYHGRNEQPNTDTGSVVDNIRNGAVAVAAMAGLSEVQWSALIDAFVSGKA